MQDLNDMLYFAEVVERGGFAAAGRALGIPKSRLSRRVSDLEAHLGVRLLQRTTRKLSLTEVGEAYLRHCQAIRESAQAAADAVAQVQTEPRGTVRVSCPVTLAQTVLAELMPAFLAQHPLVRVEMQVTNRAVNVVEEGIDVALRVRPSLEDSASMVVKRLDQARQVLVASPDLLIRQGTPTKLEDLAKLDSIAMSAPDGRASWNLIGPARCPGTGADQPASGPSACGGLLHDSGDSCARGRAQAARPAEQAVAGRARTGSGRACTSACQRWFFVRHVWWQ